MFDLDNFKKILDKDIKIKQRGREYYLNGSIKDVKLYSNNAYNIVQAKINGSKIYNTNILFDEYNRFEDFECTCPYYKENYNGLCKHIAALYFYIVNSKNLIMNNNFIAGQDFLNTFFENDEIINKRKINLFYTIEYVQHWSSRLFCNLSIKIGLDRLYVIKNLREFLESIKNNYSIDYGKKFSFRPSIHEFKQEDKKVIDFLMELYSVESTIKSESYYAQGNIFSGKNVRLDEELFEKFCIILENRRFNLLINDRLIEDVSSDFEDTPFNVLINNENNKIIAQLKYNDDCIFMGKDDNVIYSNNKLHLLNKTNKTFVFHRIARKRNTNKIEFEDDSKSKFLSIIPYILNEYSIDVSQDISKNYLRIPLSPCIYIDKYKKGVKINLEFSYGENKINPFDENKINPYIIRDYIKENEIIRLIEEAEFKINEDNIYLEDYDKIYLFFRDMLPVLSNTCTIYYTDEVKDMYSAKLNGYSSSVKTGFSGVIYIDIDIDNMNKKEIENILKSIKEKKKYHKFKNGRILSLEGEEAKKLSKLIDNVEYEELDGNSLSLSKYRAISVFERIRDENLNIENINIVSDIIDKIKSPNLQEINIPKNFIDILRDYQRIGFKWLKTLADSELGGILADDMGLGKTIQAIALIYSGLGLPSIVIAPSSLMYNWENEIKSFAPKMKTLVVFGDKKSREEMIDKISKYDVIITSYPLIRRDIELYEGIEFNYCIIDEAQHIKNPDSINAKSVKSINAKNRFALTGTPMENSLTELWSIFDFLMPGYLLSKNRFQERYEKNILKNDNDETLNEFKKIISPFILRRRKKDVLLELPDKIETKLVCELTNEQEKIYTAYAAKTKEEIQRKIHEEGFEKSRIEILAALTRLRQICCHPSMFIQNYESGSGKFELLEELLEELIGGEHRILLFSQFTSLLELIKPLLEDKGYKYLYLDGSTPVYERMSLVDRFNSGEGNIFLISLKAGGTGLNLTSADIVIHFDPWWNPAVEEQASDRVHRIGQKNVVQVFKLITKNTIEERIFELQKKKKELIDSVIKEGETFISKLTKDEIMSIFGI